MMLREAVSDSEDSDHDMIDAAVSSTYHRVRNRRFIHRARHYKNANFNELEFYYNMSETDFLLHFRVHKESFWKLYSYIKDYSGFHRRRGALGDLYRPQAPVKYQLLVFLYVLGASGSDANYKRVASRFKISNGTVKIFVDRCTKAVLELLENDAVFWPDSADRRTIAKRIQEKYGFPHCIGFLDGTIFPLEFKPSLFGEEYYSRKGCWSVHCLIICDDETRILDFLVGWPGSVHDNRVWLQSKQCMEYNKFFSKLQYVLADSAFTSSMHCISAFKKLRGVSTLPLDKEMFNTLLAKARIRIEHCIGLLKNRFPCLRNIRTIINDKRTMKRIIDRVRVCIVLHNLLVGSSYPEAWDARNEEDVGDNLGDDSNNEYAEDFVPDAVLPASTDRRSDIQQYMLEWATTT
jgi:hypothetical protein